MQLFSALNIGDEVTAGDVAAAIGEQPYKANARAATTGALAALTATATTLTANADGALAAQDGVTLVAGNRLLVKDQAAPAQNGIYDVTQVGSAGTSQVETATVVGTVSLSGDAAVVITSGNPGFAGSPLTVPVAVVNGDIDTVVGGKIRTALNATTAVTDVFTVTGAGANIILTVIVPLDDDDTLNISIDNDTCTGLTFEPTSVDTTPGVAGTPFILTRSADADTWAELAGAVITVQEGTTQAGRTFHNTNVAGGTLGSTAVTWMDESAQVTKTTATNYTIGTTNPRELRGGIITVTGAAVLAIPAVTNGDSFLVATQGAVAVSVDPNAADKIYLDGVALDDGDKITNLSTSGDAAFFWSRNDGTGWNALTNAWTDGGP